MGGGGFMFSRGGFIGEWRWGKREERSVAGGGVGVGGGGEFLPDGCARGQNGTVVGAGFVWAVDDGWGGDVVGFSFAGVGVGRAGQWGGPGVVGVGSGADWGASVGGVGGDCSFGRSDRSECGLCVAGVVVGGFGGVGGRLGGESGGGVAAAGLGGEGAGGEFSFRGGVGGLGLEGWRG